MSEAGAGLTRMEVTYDVPEDVDADVVLGPCPGCLMWQLDYTQEVAQSLGLRGFHEFVDEVLGQHVLDCPDLVELLEELGVDY